MAYRHYMELIKLPAEWCDDIVRRAASVEGQNKTHVGGSRECVIKWLNAANGFEDVTKKLFDIVKGSNEKLWGMVIDELSYLQFTEYYPGHRYDFHQDNFWIGRTGFHRKLSIVVQLSDSEDFTGGGFGFKHQNSPPSFEKGDGVIFPSPLEHRAFPVETGKRIVLVGWAQGPNFM